MGLIMVSSHRARRASVTVVDPNRNGNRRSRRRDRLGRQLARRGGPIRWLGYGHRLHWSGRGGRGRPEPVRRGGTFQQFGVAPSDAQARFSPFRIYNDELTVAVSMAVLHSYARAVDMFVAVPSTPRRWSVMPTLWPTTARRSRLFVPAPGGRYRSDHRHENQWNCCSRRGDERKGIMTVQHAQAAARYQAITDLLAADGRVDVVDIANRLGVAQETIRRDLRAMESAGKLQRVHGGAVRIVASPLVRNSQPPTAQDDLDLATRIWESYAVEPSCSAPAT